MSEGVAFDVAGVPAPQGSKTRTQWGGMREANKATRPWRQAIAYEAMAAIPAGVWTPMEGPVRVYVNFRFPRIKIHFNARGELKPSAPWHKATKPDLDKLVRCLLDGLTDAQVFRDDGQVAYVSAQKHYGDQPGMSVEVKPYRPMSAADKFEAGLSQIASTTHPDPLNQEGE